jgi:hypothetical protein
MCAWDNVVVAAGGPGVARRLLPVDPGPRRTGLVY